MSIVDAGWQIVGTCDDAETREYVLHQRTGNCESPDSAAHAAIDWPACCLTGDLDHEIEQIAKSALRASAYRPVRRVSCQMSNGVLSLRGSVPSFYMKQIAQTTVRHLLGRDLVIHNQLEVDWVS